MSIDKQIRYEIEVQGAKGFLAPLSFPIAEAALGYVFNQNPRYLTAGAILLNSLWVRGSKSLQKDGENYNESSLQCYGILNALDYNFKDNVITIPYKKKIDDGSYIPHDFKCTISDKVKRETLEDCFSLIMPNVGNPKPLTAGKMILDENWESGDEEIRTNDELLIIACLACYFIIKLKDSKLKKV